MLISLLSYLFLVVVDVANDDISTCSVVGAYSPFTRLLRLPLLLRLLMPMPLLLLLLLLLFFLLLLLLLLHLLFLLLMLCR